MDASSPFSNPVALEQKSVYHLAGSGPQVRHNVDERAGNVHIREGVSEDEFVAMRTARDQKLGAPRLIIPSIQVNMNAGHFPEPDQDGNVYLKVPAQPNLEYLAWRFEWPNN